jgi:hypothetical protein
MRFGASGRPAERWRPRRRSRLEGDTSPWKERAIWHPKGCRTQRTRSRSNTSKSRASFGPRHFCRPATGSRGRDHPRGASRHGGNRPWRHGTAAGGGNSSKGRMRRGKRACLAPISSTDRLRVARVSGRWEQVAGNAANLKTGSGVQQTRRPGRGESRRGGEKPRGRNWTGRVVPSVPMVSGQPGAGCGRDLVRTVEGHQSRTPREEGSDRAAGTSVLVRGSRGARPVCGRFEGDATSWSAEDEGFASRMRASW